MRKPYRPEVDFVVAIDPAMTTSGFALAGPAIFNGYKSGSVEGIENLSRRDPLGYLETCLIISRAVKPRVFVLTEYPTWKGFGTDAVRAAANCWLRYIDERTEDCQVIVAKVSPPVWFSRYLGETKDPQPVYMAKAVEIDRQGRALIEENESAAICLLDYALSDLRSDSPFLFAPKAKKVKV